MNQLSDQISKKNKIFAANWKLQKTPDQAQDFSLKFIETISQQSLDVLNKEFFIFPQNFSLQTVIDQFKLNPLNEKFFIGPQNVYFEKSGAFTGENSADLAKLMGAKTLLIGHSERRQLFGETHQSLNLKVKLAQNLDLLPVFCIGETSAERQASKTEQICFEQIEQGLKDIDLSKRIIIAYEPVWAIGTGQVAKPEQVKEVHLQIFRKLKQLGFKKFEILYGGSVKPENAGELIQIDHVDGFLVGGASLEVESFYKICCV